MKNAESESGMGIQNRQVPPHLTLYSKPGCHLCDEMKITIDQVATRMALTIEIIDISTDPALTERYGLEIPVLLVDGKKAAKYRVTERDLEARLRARRGPA